MFTDSDPFTDGDRVGMKSCTHPSTGHPLRRDAAAQELWQRCEGGWRSVGDVPPLEVIWNRFVIVVVARDGVHGAVLVSHVHTRSAHDSQ